MSVATTRTVGRAASIAPQGGARRLAEPGLEGDCPRVPSADGKGPRYGYTQDGKLAQRIWARGIVTDYSYDGWGSLTNTVYSDATPTVTLFYDAMGRQTDALKECKRQHLESQINQTKKRPQENNFSPFVTTSQNVFESFIRIPSFEEMGGIVIDKGVEHTSIVANQCKCCEIMIGSREWREYESGGTEYGIAQVNLHNRSCEDLKNQAKLVRKIPGVSVSFVYESDF